MQIGDKIPSFTLPTPDGGTVSSDDLKGGWTVIYFYPKDNTPGCTTEAKDFSAEIEAFQALGARVIGISADSPKKHANFIAKQELKVGLLSDEDTSVCEAFGVWVEKKMYGKTYMGILRSTFIVAPDLKVAHEWKKVKVKEHASDVLSTLKEAINQHN
ncbi:thioredoxin-dependent thiol peroxidase [Ponticaulis koreensis]|uniref:thioredoxin-dependent thiol peroxidase n=1 Tax=Ponticaulis koreensis TaxID=1123045 RepID=UPI0003B61B1D|nr:thioredoxin-dependent thiol peroxidase [Ponticaulis koreensis]